jgi:hypothetical protein
MLHVIGWLILIGIAVQYWPVVVGVVVVVVAVKFLAACYDAYQDEIAAKREVEAARQARLIRHADEEHRLVQQGNLDGVYGSYPVPNELRGVGIWLAG